ncbi:DUF1010 domain-containing protein [Acidovorax temperans]|uniref:DUF1010 domain-containing protein n=1 Tax=Acidovorax temperans TaxID=80878 RepID=UPI0035B20D22
MGAEIAISPGFAWFFVLLASSPFAASASSYHFESIAPPQHPGCPTLQACVAPQSKSPCLPDARSRPYHRPLFFSEPSSCAFFLPCSLRWPSPPPPWHKPNPSPRPAGWCMSRSRKARASRPRPLTP